MSNSVFPELQCSCGAGSCLILTSRKGDNNGKQFYKCPENQVGTYFSSNGRFLGVFKLSSCILELGFYLFILTVHL